MTDYAHADPPTPEIIERIRETYDKMRDTIEWAAADALEAAEKREGVLHGLLSEVNAAYWGACHRDDLFSRVKVALAKDDQ